MPSFQFILDNRTDVEYFSETKQQIYYTWTIINQIPTPRCCKTIWFSLITPGESHWLTLNKSHLVPISTQLTCLGVENIKITLTLYIWISEWSHRILKYEWPHSVFKYFLTNALNIFGVTVLILNWIFYIIFIQKKDVDSEKFWILTARYRI